MGQAYQVPAIIQDRIRGEHALTRHNLRPRTFASGALVSYRVTGISANIDPARTRSPRGRDPAPHKAAAGIPVRGAADEYARATPAPTMVPAAMPAAMPIG